MAHTDVLVKTLLHRASDSVADAGTIDKAVAGLAGVLYPTFFLRRVDVGMRVNHDRLVICGLWSAHYVYERESLLVLDRDPEQDHLMQFPER
jgi:hypothetical protein